MRQKPYNIKPFSERFWSKVDKRGPDDCWLWMAGKHSFGYGMCSRGRIADGRVTSNRAAWELTYGPIPDGQAVCHRCDVPACCNPAHLFLGTRADNNRDMFAKGRNDNSQSLRGTAHHSAKLTPEAVREMRTLFATGLRSKDIGARFGVRQSTAHSAITGKTWGHVS